MPTILLVDDFDDARDIYETYLRFHGYRVISAQNGTEALAAAQAERPDLVLLDLRMPMMDGTTVMRILRADPSFATTPVVALTAYALDKERDAALQAGFDAVIAKPCLPDDLLEHVSRLLSHR